MLTIVRLHGGSVKSSRLSKSLLLSKDLTYEGSDALQISLQVTFLLNMQLWENASDAQQHSLHCVLINKLPSYGMHCLWSCVNCFRGYN